MAANFQHIAFIASNRSAALFHNDPAFVYRCENLGLSLSEQGHDVTFAHITSFKQSDKPYEVVVFHRPHASFRLWFLLQKLRRNGVVVIADFDDLVFSETYIDYSPGVLNGLVSRSMTRRRFRSHRYALSWFDGVTVSTEPLVSHARRLNPATPVGVIHNCVHHTWSQDAPIKAVKRIISYFPGTRSHHRDFAQIQIPISRFLQAHSEVKLQITGPLEFSIDADPGQISHEKRVPFPQYQVRVRGSWVNLAPLEDTPFNQCKSALKVMEAGYWGIPTLCSSNADNVRFTSAGAILSMKHRDWIDNLERLLDESEYQRVTHELRQRILELANVDDQARRFLQFVATLKK